MTTSGSELFNNFEILLKILKQINESPDPTKPKEYWKTHIKPESVSPTKATELAGFHRSHHSHILKKFRDAHPNFFEIVEKSPKTEGLYRTALCSDWIKKHEKKYDEINKLLSGIDT